MEDSYKEVYFDQYCGTCKYQKTVEDDEPCYSCLAEPVNLYSHKPVKWEGKSGYENYLPEEPKETEKPTIKNLFDEAGDYSNDDMTYTVNNHICRFETSQLLNKGLYSNPLLSFAPEECAGKTIYIKRKSLEAGGNQGITFTKWVAVSKKGYRQTVLSEVSAGSSLVELNFPETITADSVDLVVCIYGDKDVKSDGFSYAAIENLMITFDEITEDVEWIPYES